MAWATPQLVTDRFCLRELTLDDVTPTYLNWFANDVAARYITAAAQMQRLADLRSYVSARLDRDDVWFLGIFDRQTGSHVGNIKYEPVDSRLGYAIMGVLIGDPDARGRGVTAEVLSASAEWLHTHRRIREIVLGVDTANRAAIRAYEKVGFVIAETPHIANPPKGVSTMVWFLGAGRSK